MVNTIRGGVMLPQPSFLNQKSGPFPGEGGTVGGSLRNMAWEKLLDFPPGNPYFGGVRGQPISMGTSLQNAGVGLSHNEEPWAGSNKP